MRVRPRIRRARCARRAENINGAAVRLRPTSGLRRDHSGVREARWVNPHEGDQPHGAHRRVSAGLSRPGRQCSVARPLAASARARPRQHSGRVQTAAALMCARLLYAFAPAWPGCAQVLAWRNRGSDHQNRAACVTGQEAPVDAPAGKGERVSLPAHSELATSSSVACPRPPRDCRATALHNLPPVRDPASPPPPPPHSFAPSWNSTAPPTFR